MDALQVRFGKILIGQDFKRGDSKMLWRRERGTFARPVSCIGGHSGIYGGSQISIDVDEIVTPVQKNGK